MRNYQASELIQRTLSTVLHTETLDPRLSKVTITGVDLSPDFKQATIFFTQMNDSKKAILTTEKVFKKALGYFRAQLSEKTGLRYTPQLSFQFDRSQQNAERIAKLLSKN